MSKETKYPAEVLLNSRALSGYQKDFARAVLGRREYTVREAQAALDAYFQRPRQGQNTARKDVE